MPRYRTRVGDSAVEHRRCAWPHPQRRWCLLPRRIYVVLRAIALPEAVAHALGGLFRSARRQAEASAPCSAAALPTPRRTPLAARRHTCHRLRRGSQPRRHLKVRLSRRRPSIVRAHRPPARQVPCALPTAAARRIASALRGSVQPTQSPRGGCRSLERQRRPRTEKPAKQRSIPNAWASCAAADAVAGGIGVPNSTGADTTLPSLTAIESSSAAPRSSRSSADGGVVDQALFVLGVDPRVETHVLRYASKRLHHVEACQVRVALPRAYAAKRGA